MAEKVKTVDEEQEPAETIDESALAAKGSASDDELSLSEALTLNPAKMFFVRNTIKLKNHISIIPMLMCIISMMVLTFSISPIVNATVRLHNDTLNAFFFFLNVLLSLITVLAYINVFGQHASFKKKLWMSILFYVCVVAEVYLDYYFLKDIQIETGLYNGINKVSDDEKYFYIARSQRVMIAHMICLGVTTVLAILAPILQPLTRKIHVKAK
jgi:hypothetical protein